MNQILTVKSPYAGPVRCRRGGRRTFLVFMSLMASAAMGAQNTYTLQQCKEMALENNVAVLNARNEVEMAKEQQKEAFTLYFPSVSAAGASFRSDEDLLQVKLHPREYVPSVIQKVLPAKILELIPASLRYGIIDEGSVAGIAAMQPVFAGGQIVNGNRLARLGVEASEVEMERAVYAVNYATEQYFWQIIALKEKLVTVDTVLVSLDRIAGDVEAAVEAGVAMRNDLLQVQLKLNEMQSSRMQAESGIRILKMLLRQHIGLEETEFDITADTGLEAYRGGIDLLKRDHEASLSLTPEYRLLEMNCRSKSLAYKMEVGKHLPSVGVGAGYSYVDLLDNDRGIGLVFATVSVPISSWWGGSHAIRRKKLDRLNAENQFRSDSERLLINMQNTWDGLENAYRQVEIAERTIAQAEENLRLQRDSYNAGTVAISELLEAQMTYQGTRDSYVEAFSDLQMKMIAYRQATGRDEEGW